MLAYKSPDYHHVFISHTFPPNGTVQTNPFAFYSIIIIIIIIISNSNFYNRDAFLLGIKHKVHNTRVYLSVLVIYLHFTDLHSLHELDNNT